MNLTKKNLGFAAALAGLLAIAGCREREERRAEQGSMQPAQQAEQQSAQAGQQMDKPGQPEQQTAQAGEQAGQQATGGQAATGTEQVTSGELLRASAEEIVLRPETGQQGELRLKVSESTTVTIDGQEGKISDLQEGAQVRASYADAQGERTATRIEAEAKK